MSHQRKTNRHYGAIWQLVQIMDVFCPKGFTEDNFTPAQEKRRIGPYLYNLWKWGKLKMVKPGKRGCKGYPATYKVKSDFVLDTISQTPLR